MIYVRYFILRTFTLTPPIRERKLRRQLRKLNLSTQAIRFARTYPIFT